MYSLILVFFFFKQKTAYEMRISDWSSDVCSSDLQREKPERHRRRDHQRSRDALAENRAPIGLCGCGLAACHALFRSCQLTTAICACGGLAVKRGAFNGFTLRRKDVAPAAKRPSCATTAPGGAGSAEGACRPQLTPLPLRLSPL